MRATYKTPPAAPPATSAVTWLRTDHPVVPINPSTWGHLREVEAALQLGVTATADANRPGFYEIEVGNNWFYIHIPSRITGVYLVAVGKRSASARSAVRAHQCA
jgi:hypothetical protein